MNIWSLPKSLLVSAQNLSGMDGYRRGAKPALVASGPLKELLMITVSPFVRDGAVAYQPLTLMKQHVGHSKVKANARR